MVGKIGLRFSNHWKNPSQIFQALEKTLEDFQGLEDRLKLLPAGKPSCGGQALLRRFVFRSGSAGGFALPSVPIRLDSRLSCEAQREAWEIRG